MCVPNEMQNLLFIETLMTVSAKIYDTCVNGMILILMLLISRSLISASRMVFIYLNVFALPEHLRMLVTSIVVTNT